MRMITITRDVVSDVRVAISFLTRVPVSHPEGATPDNFVRAHRVFPLVGGAIGAAIGLTFAALISIGLPGLAAAAVSLGVGALATGALHEDGLADMADGFGGGRDRAAKLEIMRDSRLGTYGALILLVAFVTKASALAALSGPAAVASLAACHALSRSMLPLMVIALPAARTDGLSATAGVPTHMVALIAVLSGVAVALLALPWTFALSAALVAAICALGVGSLAWRQIGGQTGDVLGAAEQVSETAILLLLAAALSGP
jgi:adenosylcobinamide-GDP ribazoletransferase